jgi:hypothetical protein
MGTRRYISQDHRIRPNHCASTHGESTGDYRAGKYNNVIFKSWIRHGHIARSARP